MMGRLMKLTVVSPIFIVVHQIFLFLVVTDVIIVFHRML